jgi:transcriptional regulator with XRE-family HTH domain
MGNGEKKIALRSNSLGYLERIVFDEEIFDEEKSQAKHAFEKVFTHPQEENFYVHLRQDNGVKVSRTDATGVYSVNYESFDPPSFWNTPYQLMRVKVGQPQPKVFYYHPGEEFVFPIRGEGVHYDFFWTEPGSKKLPHLYPSKPALVKEGEGIRIQPQIPHRAWGKGKDETDAWMITRPYDNEAGQIYVAQLDTDASQSSSRQIGLVDLERQLPGHYALLAWGISEEIRLKRLRTNRTLAEVADACEIDAAHLSRIEKGITNVNLETLIKLFRELDINVAKLVALPTEAMCLNENLQMEDDNRIKPKPIFKEPKARISLVKDPITPRFKDHFVHPQIWQFPAKTTHTFTEAPNEWTTTWVMIQGRALFDLNLDGRNVSEVLDEGNVLHLRQNGAKITEILALADSMMLQIVFDPLNCHCRKA